MQDEKLSSIGLSSPVCPLCGAKDIRSLDTIKTSDLKWLYRRDHNVRVLQEFGCRTKISFSLCQRCDLRFFYPLVTGSEAFYEAMQKNCLLYYMDEKSEYEFGKRYIPQDCNVLEIGSGKGAFAKIINTRNYLGLEFSNKAIELANASGVNVINEPIESHAENNKERYDVVCAFQVLEHVSNVGQFIEASAKCLKKDGILIYSVPSNDSYVSLMLNATLNMPPHHVTRWSDKCLKNITNFFPLELIALEHERLADVHRRWYSMTRVYRASYRMIAKKQPLVDISVRGLLIKRAAFLLSRIHLFGLSDSHSLPDGHSVSVAYRKT